MTRLLLRVLALSLVFGLLVPATLASAAPSAVASEIEVAYVADETPPVAGQVTSYTATLVSQGTPVAGETMTLLVRTVGSSAYTPVATAVTDAQGQAQATARLLHSSAIRWSFAGDGSYQPSTTPDFVRAIATRVTARVTDRTQPRGRPFVFYGRTFPAKPGTRVTLWRGEIPPGFGQSSAPAPVQVASAIVRADGSYRIRHAFAHPGGRQLFVRVPRGGANAAGFSNYVRIRVG